MPLENSGNKRQRKPKGQSIMDNPETLVTLMGTQKMMTTNRTKKTNTEN